MKKIGFIGLGIMGESMSENLVKKSGKDVYVFDINKDKVNQLVELGALPCATILELGKMSDYIFIMVPTKKHVALVMEELLPTLDESKIVIDMSTIEPSVSVEIADRVNKTGAVMLDAPVVKSKAAAITGDLGIYVGGDEVAYNEVRPMLECMGSNIIRMGENGKGLVMKICHNMLVAQIQNGVNEMLIMAQKAGLDFDMAVKAVSYGGGQNFYLDGKANSIKEEEFSPKFSVQNMHKDIHIAVELAKELGIDLYGAKYASEIYDSAMEEEMASLDFSATYKIAKKKAGV